MRNNLWTELGDEYLQQPDFVKNRYRAAFKRGLKMNLNYLEKCGWIEDIRLMK